MTKCDLCSQEFTNLKKFQVISSEAFPHYSRRIRELNLCSVCASELRNRHSIKVMEIR